ncbi:MAG: leucine-rich repeat protein, partial [Muribaculaceae bacterium]|nr:leucine-rich repeat protein [Muribaculaceae bacterium]
MKIGSRAFYNCGKLSVNLGDTGIETIGGQAFYNCQNLSSDLVFPSTIK